jgi:uncharacterized repeat protein (TIGR03803 family)
MHNLKKILAAFFCATTLAGAFWQTAQAQTAQVQVLCAFTSTNNGINPFAGLCAGQDGNLYGTTTRWGTNGDNGTVFEVTTNGLLTPLVSFANTNGSDPQAGLTQGSDGNFYGTTVVGGTSGIYGTVFKVTTNGLLTLLASFTNANGAFPYSGLTLGNDGNFYGTTYFGGSNSVGTIFRVTTNGALTSLVSFNITNGSSPHAGLMLGSDGNFYGTTSSGGTNGGYGTIFKMTTNGVVTSLVSLNDTNGAYPRAALIPGNDGNLYGTTYYGGSNSLGTVFKVTTNGVLTTLVSFNNTNGANPIAGLTLGSDGNFYGTTVNGGSSNLGTAFEMTTNGVLTTLASFNNTNGANPYGGWTVGSDGNFYGTTANGGSATNGTVLKLIVPPMLGPVSFSGQILQVAVNGLARPSIQIQVATDLTASWSVLTNLVFTNGTGLVIDPAAANAPQRFYRAVVQ